MQRNLLSGWPEQRFSRLAKSGLPTPSPANCNAAFTPRLTPIISAKGRPLSLQNGRIAPSISLEHWVSAGYSNAGGSDTITYSASMRLAQSRRNRCTSSIVLPEKSACTS